MSRGDDQAYPFTHEPRPGERETLWGMTIRERFAMAAMQGMLANSSITQLVVRNAKSDESRSPATILAIFAVGQADLLLHALDDFPDVAEFRQTEDES